MNICVNTTQYGANNLLSIDKKINIHEQWDNWCNLDVVEKDGTVRPCKYRCNDINHLQRHRNGTDKMGRHSVTNIRFGPPLHMEGKKLGKRPYRKRVTRDANMNVVYSGILFMPSTLTEEAKEQNARSLAMANTTLKSKSSPVSLRWHNVVMTRDATTETLIMSTEASPDPPSTSPTDSSLLGSPMPPSPTLSSVSLESISPPSPALSSVSLESILSSPSSGLSEEWIAGCWLPGPPRSSTYNGGLTGAFSVRPPDMSPSMSGSQH